MVLSSLNHMASVYRRARPSRPVLFMARIGIKVQGGCDQQERGLPEICGCGREATTTIVKAPE